MLDLFGRKLPAIKGGEISQATSTSDFQSENLQTLMLVFLETVREVIFLGREGNSLNSISHAKPTKRVYRF
jgi:hypothetical protein